MKSIVGHDRQFPMGPILLWVGISLAAGALGAVASTPGAWYQALAKPSWNPPASVFGPVWTTLYLLMGIAAGLVWTTGAGASRRRALLLFGVQLGLNALWSWIFFHWHRPDLALLDLLLLWLTIIATIVTFRKLRPLAGWLLVPYLCWVTFAGVLNAAIASRNPGGVPPDLGPRAVGLAVADCAPWDGTATSIYLSPRGEVVSLPPPEPYLHLVVYQPGRELSGRQVDIRRRDGNLGAGIAVRCDSGGACASTEVGFIEFDRIEADAELTGWYRLTFSGEPVTGTFRAVWSSRSAICG